MKIIEVRNVNLALPQGLDHLFSVGIPMPSRAGDVIAAPSSVVTIYKNPCERVVFWPERDANPWFHFFEALYMITGENKVRFLEKFIKDFGKYSDDGETLSGFYGYRWRRHFGYDQIKRIVALLKQEPFSRRAVLGMWDPAVDLRDKESGKDLPCNTMIVFGIMYGKRDENNRLHMTVFNRSNDIIFGLYGANAVHLSMLQEYIAAQLNLVVGTMTTHSVNFHAYSDVYNKTRRGALLTTPKGIKCPYETGEVAPYPLIDSPNSWDAELVKFLANPDAIINTSEWENGYFPLVAMPMWRAHAAYKARDMTAALHHASFIAATDWRKAAVEWLERRQR